jgi:hypothetical protein
MPRESLDTKFFDEGINLRGKSGALRGVPSWNKTNTKIRTFQNNSDGSLYTSDIASIKPVSVTQWSRSGTEYLDVVTVGIDGSSICHVHLLGGNLDPATQIEMTIAHPITYDTSWGIDNFIFNEMSIINGKNAPPQYSDDKIGYDRIPNWLSESYGSPITSISDKLQYEITTVTLTDWSSVGGPLSAVVGDKFDSISTSSISALGEVKDTSPYQVRGLSQFKGRLVALNLYNDLGDGAGSNDIIEHITMAFSSSITSRNSLSGVEWYASSTNSAGDDILTDTPGPVIDAMQLGDYLMVYKSDSVYRYSDTGNPYFLTGDTVFTDDGVLSDKCIVNIGSNRHFVVGNYGIYIHSGGPESASVSDNRVTKSFYKDLPVSKEDRGLTFAFHDTLEKEVWICYRPKSENPLDSNKGCTKALVFDIDNNVFFNRTLPNLTDITETEVEGSQSIISASVDEPYNSSSTGYLYILNDDGSVEPDGYVRFNSRTFGMVQSIKDVYSLYPTCEKEFKVMMVGGMVPTKPDLSSVVADVYDPLSDYKEDYREFGRYITLDVGMSGSIDPSISGMSVDFLDGGIR